MCQCALACRVVEIIEAVHGASVLAWEQVSRRTPGLVLAGPRPGTAGASYVEITTPLATGPRVVTSRTVPSGQRFGPSEDETHWIVTNSFASEGRVGGNARRAS